jgi:hypothetical protein
VVACNNSERGRAGRREILGFDLLYSCGGRSAALQIRDEAGDDSGITFDFDEDTVRVIAHKTAEVGGSGEAVDERPESNSLDDSGDT